MVMLSEGIIIGMDSDDTLEALVIARRALNEELEPLQIPDKPYDVLVHQIAGLMLKNRRLEFSEILEICQKRCTLRKFNYGRCRKSLQVHA